MPTVNPPSPLAGRRVVVTRAEHQADGLLDLLRAAGAEAVALPLLQVVPPTDGEPLKRAAAEIEAFDWVAFSSANAVQAFFPRFARSLPATVRIAVVGPATAAALRAQGIEPHVTARRSDAEGLAAELQLHLQPRSRVLLPQAADARPALASGLAAAGAEVTTVVAYDKRLPAAAQDDARRLFGAAPLGWVTFTSPRIVRHFAELFGAEWRSRRAGLGALSIGRVTSAELRRAGVEGVHEAALPNDEALVQTLLAAIAAVRGPVLE